MAKFCTSCRQTVEDDSKLFCPYCGSPINAELQMMLELQQAKKKAGPTPAAKNQRPVVKRETPKPPRRRSDEDLDYTPIKRPEPKKKTGWIVAAVVLCAAVAVFLWLK